MFFSIISFTKNGYELSKKIQEKIKKHDPSYRVSCFVKCEALNNETGYVNEDIKTWTKERFSDNDVIIFIGSTGIAVRAVSGVAENKMTDSPVIVIDEKSNFVIPLLSGHMGGANEISIMLAKLLDACPVITTATDINDKWAVDTFAKEKNLHILNKEKIRKVSSKSLEGKRIRIMVPDASVEGADVIVLDKAYKDIDEVMEIYKYAPEQMPLLLCPKEYILGIGCKKGKTVTEIEAAVSDLLKKYKIDIDQIACIASVDLKKEEEGILKYADKNKIDYLTFTAEELSKVEGDFTESEFVKEKTGVGNICERAALKACKYGGKLICSKSIYNGITLAIAKRKIKMV